MPSQHNFKPNLLCLPKGNQLLSGLFCKYVGQAFNKMLILPPFLNCIVKDDQQTSIFVLLSPIKGLSIPIQDFLFALTTMGYLGAQFWCHNQHKYSKKIPVSFFVKGNAFKKEYLCLFKVSFKDF